MFLRAITAAFFVCFLVVPTMGATLSVHADQTRLNADHSASVTVTVTLQDDSGHPLSGKEIFLNSSSGRFSDVKDIGNGKYRATLDVPAQAAPRSPGYLLILASALLDSQAPAAGLAVPVYSNLVLQGKAAPGIAMSARSHGRILGKQITTGADGSFRLVVPVPPGVGSLQIIAKKGTQEKSDTVDLKIGGTTRHIVQVVPDTIVPGGNPGYVNVFAIQGSGRVESTDRFRMDSDASGNLSSLISRGNGTFRPDILSRIQRPRNPL